MFFYEDSKSKCLCLLNKSNRDRYRINSYRVNHVYNWHSNVSRSRTISYWKCKVHVFFIQIQLSFLMGIVALIGLKNTVLFFVKRSKMVGSIFFFLGFFMIIMGWYMFTLLGFISQLYGIFMLFRSFITTIFAYC